MAWVKQRRRYLYVGSLLILLSLTTLYACIRQAKSEPANPTAAPAVATAPATPQVIPVQAPAQAQEKDLASQPSLVAPHPATALPKFEDPTKLPTPGPPYNQENTNGDVVLKNFPVDASGQVDWVKAFQESLIKPHEALDLNKPPTPPFMFDIEIPAIGSMPNVIFPHFPHTFWLDCANCHPGIFMMKKGGNPISMVKIVNGEFCGRCHGRVAFPLANCTRCHVKPKS
jgi:c(7)-type cytochrome triheme protein